MHGGYERARPRALSFRLRAKPYCAGYIHHPTRFRRRMTYVASTGNGHRPTPNPFHGSAHRGAARGNPRGVAGRWHTGAASGAPPAGSAAGGGIQQSCAAGAGTPPARGAARCGCQRHGAAGAGRRDGCPRYELHPLVNVWASRALAPNVSSSNWSMSSDNQEFHPYCLTGESYPAGIVAS
jgi:hypothetical protein